MEFPAGSMALEVAHGDGRRRLLVRRESTVVPFFWRGFLPLLGLVAVAAYGIGPFARQWIESDVQRQIRAVLDAQDMQWVKLEVSGQDVWLSGSMPAAGLDDHALEAARKAACDTWLGPKTCAVAVGGQFTRPASGRAAPAVQNEAEACEQRFAEVMSQEKIAFEINSAIVSPASTPLLKQLAEAGSKCPGNVIVAGHTDSIGDPVANQALSEARAAAVRHALIDLGIPGNRLEAKGFGSAQPIAENDSAAGRAKNRRIEFRVVVPD